MIKNLLKHTAALAFIFSSTTSVAKEGGPVTLISSTANESVIKIDVNAFSKKPVMVGQSNAFVIQTPNGVSSSIEFW